MATCTHTHTHTHTYAAAFKQRGARCAVRGARCEVRGVRCGVCRPAASALLCASVRSSALLFTWRLFSLTMGAWRDTSTNYLPIAASLEAPGESGRLAGRRRSHFASVACFGSGGPKSHRLMNERHSCKEEGTSMVALGPARRQSKWPRSSSRTLVRLSLQWYPTLFRSWVSPRLHRIVHL